jgi:hypothetical protein
MLVASCFISETCVVGPSAIIFKALRDIILFLSPKIFKSNFPKKNPFVKKTLKSDTLL